MPVQVDLQTFGVREIESVAERQVALPDDPELARGRLLPALALEGMDGVEGSLFWDQNVQVAHGPQADIGVVERGQRRALEQQGRDAGAVQRLEYWGHALEQKTVFHPGAPMNSLQDAHQGRVVVLPAEIPVKQRKGAE